MTDLFLKVLNLSISASYLVLAVAGLRLCLKKAPKWVWPVLWGLVALRLVCPVSIESGMSLIPDPEPVSREVFAAYAPPMVFETPAQHQVNTVNAAENRNVEVKTELRPDDYLALAWLAGAGLMILYTGVSYASLRRRVGKAARVGKGVYESRNVASPFVLGLLRPRIYLPVGLSDEDKFYILAHEEAHIRRRDHIWKPLGFVLLALHWFNPVMWLAYILLCRDIELACDEKVIKQLGREGRADYSQALLSCAIRHWSIAACPLAFGEVGVKQRVKSVLNYKKPTFWVVLVAVIASVAVSVCFLTNPKEAEKGQLTVEDVRALAAKGYSLTWEDLEGYEYEDIGSGRAIFDYDVNENIHLMLFNAGNTPTNGPEVFELRCKHEGAFIDLLQHPELLEDFLELHNKPLEEGECNHWNLNMSLGDLTPAGGRVYLYSPYGMENVPLSCEEGFTLLEKRKGKWVELPQKIEPPQTQRALPTAQYQQDLDWTERYGVLSDGEYQLRKWVYFNHAGVEVGVQLSADFVVSVDGKPQLTAAEFLNRKKFEDEPFYDKIQDREEYAEKHRNSWADYEDFAYVEEVDESLPILNCHRYYQLDNGMFMSMNGRNTDKRPNNIQLDNGIYQENILADWIDSREALAYALDLFSQPLAPGQENHIGVELALDAWSPTGAAVSIVGALPEGMAIRTNMYYSLETQDAWGRWETLPDLEGDTSLQCHFPEKSPATRTLDWTEKYGPLPAGTYRIHFDTQICYDNGEEQVDLALSYYDLTATFTIGESQQETLAAQARPFAPGEVHDLTQAVLCVKDAEYVLDKEEDLRYLESLLANAKPEKGVPGCPFYSTTYLVRDDGAVFWFRHAEDSCEAIEVGTDYYSYDSGLGKDFWSTFGIAQYSVQATYDELGRVVQWDEYEWGRRVPGSTTKLTYDEAGNLYIQEKIDDNGTTTRKQIFGYDDRGNQVEWWNYDGDTLWSRGTREFDENNNLVKETSYRGDVLYLGTAYVHDDKGRILEEISTLEGEPSGTARYEWSDDHHYRVYNYTPEGKLTHSTAYVTDQEGRMIRQEFFSQYGGSEGFEEYEYVEGNEEQMIVRYYDKFGKLTEEGWRNID